MILGSTFSASFEINFLLITLCEFGGLKTSHMAGFINSVGVPFNDIAPFPLILLQQTLLKSLFLFFLIASI